MPIDRDLSRVPRRAAGPCLLATLLLVLVLPLAGAADAAADPPDAERARPFAARFFGADGEPGADGYVVSNADGIPFLTSFYQLGGPDAVGLPLTHRFVRYGLVTQAFERLVLQWRPRVGVVYLARAGSEAGPYPAEATQPLPASRAPASAIEDALSWGPWRGAERARRSDDAACASDEAMMFNPPRPTAGQAVEVSVTSARSLANVSLSGAFAPVLTAVELGGRGYVWTWAIRVDGPGQYTYDFSADGEVCVSRVLAVGGNPARSPLPI
jgi:hypothetical protein